MYMVQSPAYASKTPTASKRAVDQTLGLSSLMDQQVEELYAEEVLERAQALLSAFLTSKATHSQ